MESRRLLKQDKYQKSRYKSYLQILDEINNLKIRELKNL